MDPVGSDPQRGGDPGRHQTCIHIVPLCRESARDVLGVATVAHRRKHERWHRAGKNEVAHEQVGSTLR